MSLSKLMLSRSQLSTFLGDKDPDAIRAFERLFAVGDQIESGILVPRGYIDGLVCSEAADTDHDVTIAPGVARDAGDTYSLRLASAITKRIDAAWAAGNNAGGLFSGAVAVDTWYYLFLIRKDADGSIDAGWDTFKTAANKPAGYSAYRRIRAYKTDAAANIIPTDQNGDFIKIRAPVTNRALAGLANTNRNAYAVTAPPGTVARVLAQIRWPGTTSTQYFWIDDSLRADAAASSTNNNIRVVIQYDTQGRVLDLSVDSSSQVYARGNSTSIEFELATLGWIDDRGRDA